MKYVTLKDVCTINMGQSPDSDSYNDNGIRGFLFFREMLILEKDIQLQESGVQLQLKWQHLKIY